MRRFQVASPRTRAAATTLIAAAFAASTLAASPAGAALEASDTTWDGSVPPQGVYFHWYEPSFYAGFAPRTQDPSRLHIQLSRGNQVRVTLVLGDAELDNYLGDLQQRRAITQEMIDAKAIELTTNREWERFTKRLDDAGVAAAIAAKGSPEAYRAKSLEIMRTLNPERVHTIKMPLDAVAARWHAVLSGDLGDADARLDAANAALPGRIYLTDLGGVDAALAKAIDAAHAGKPDAPAFRAAAQAFIEQATGGHYRVVDGAVVANEFTAIYPAGTIEGTTTYKGEKLPDFGVTGVWPLIRRTTGRGIVGMVDYLSPNPGYGFITMLPYQFAGGITYNAFHNAGVRCQLDSTPFLPSAWRRVTGERSGKPYQNLWIVARGPTSHGCTRLPSGHMSELRQIVPSESDTLTHVQTFRNLPGCYDVFDIDGDLQPEVMGVRYFIAYSLINGKPDRLRVKNERRAYYDWLYGGDLSFENDQGVFHDVRDCRFVGRDAEEGRQYGRLLLREADYQPETVQFYRMVDIPFARELRKVGVTYPGTELFVGHEARREAALHASAERGER